MPDNDTHHTGEKEWWSRFFRAFADTGIVASACKAAKIERCTVYLYRRENPEFARRWEQSEKDALTVLEDVATGRALKQSDSVLIFLLKTRGREKYGDKPELRLSGDLTVRTMAVDDASGEELRRRIADIAAEMVSDRPGDVCET